MSDGTTGAGSGAEPPTGGTRLGWWLMWLGVGLIWATLGWWVLTGMGPEVNPLGILAGSVLVPVGAAMTSLR